MADRRLYNLFSGCIRTSVSNIFPDGGRFQPRLLQYHSKTGSNAISRQFILPDSIQSDLSLIHIIEPHQKIDKRRFSTSCRTHNRNSLPWLHMKIQILNQRPLWCIGKRDMFQIYVSFHILKFPNRLFLFWNRRLVNQRKNPLCRHQRILKFRHYPGNFIERFRILIGIVQKASQLPHSNGSPNSQQRSDDSYRCIDNGIYKPSGWIYNRRKERRLHGISCQTFV